MLVDLDYEEVGELPELGGIGDAERLDTVQFQKGSINTSVDSKSVVRLM